MKRARRLWLAAGIVVLAFWSVEPGSGQEQQREKGGLVKLDGLESRVPASWHNEKPDNAMRLKQFRLSPIGDDKEHGEVVIFYFGEGQGGSAESNIKRWKSQFKPPEGKTIQEASKVEKFKVGGVPVTYLDIRGTYSFLPPSNPNAKLTIRPNYRMLGVVLETKKGPYFIRMLGPADTIAHYKKGFDEWIKGFK